MKYSLERKESVLKKLLPSESCSVAEVSEEEGICTATLFNWRKAARTKGQLVPSAISFLSPANAFGVTETRKNNTRATTDFSNNLTISPSQKLDQKTRTKGYKNNTTITNIQFLSLIHI